MTIEQIKSLSLRHQPEFRILALTLTRDEDRARDLLQEVNYLILKYRNNFQPGTDFAAWVKTIIRNTFISDYRRTRRRARIIARNQHPANWHGEPTVPNTALKTLDEEDVLALINQLPPVYRKTFMLHFQERRYKEIAALTGVPVGTTKSRIFAARMLLKKKLRQRGISA